LKYLEVLPLRSLAFWVEIPFQAPGAFLPYVTYVNGSGEKAVVPQDHIMPVGHVQARCVLCQKSPLDFG
jgi:hypothetical protein